MNVGLIVIGMLICIVCSCFTVYNGRIFRSELEDNCLDIMALLDQNYMAELGC